MKIIKSITILLVLFTLNIVAGDGLVTVKSENTFSNTVDKLETILIENGMTIFNKISHSDGAKKVGLNLRPTELIIFGNPKIGTKLMQCKQTSAIDLPQKVLIWKDQAGQVWISYNDPDYLVKRHKIDECKKVTEKIKKALNKFIKAASEKK